MSILERPRLLGVTLYTIIGHGNLLQNYALQAVLESLGFDVDNLCASIRRDTSILARIIKAIKILTKLVLATIGLKKYRKQFSFAIPDLFRRKRFNRFSKTYIRKRIYTTYKDALSGDKKRWDVYKYVVVGSDQVWHNWSHTAEELEFFYLSFIARAKRVAYAPSFGFTKFDMKDREIHKKGLSGFPSLSCRERDGLELIKRETGLDAELVLDPTLLLSCDDWVKIERKPFYHVPKHYALVYFLGNQTEEYKHVIEEMANGREIIDILTPKWGAHYMTTPDESIWLIRNADVILTDSFHCVVFSILFRKQHMVVFRRVEENMMDMFGRIETLLSNLGLMGCVYESGANAKEFNANYSLAKVRLEKLRMESMKYLQYCVNIHPGS